MMKFALMARVVIAMTAWNPSQALTFSFSYASPDAGASFNASGLLTTGDTLNIDGGYDFNGISSSVDGDPTTTLTINPNQPGVSRSDDGLFAYDNVLFPDAPSVSLNGLRFTSASFEYNLFFNSDTRYALLQAENGDFTANSTGTLLVSQVSDVPELKIWGMMLAGFTLISLNVRISQRNTLFCDGR